MPEIVPEDIPRALADRGMAERRCLPAHALGGTSL